MGCWLLAALWVADAGDVDLAKLPRKIAPPKDANAPKYCCLVFGEKAERTVWLAIDGNALHIDRNSDGDFDDADEKVGAKVTEEGAVATFAAGDLPIPKLDPAELTVRLMKPPEGKAKIYVSARIRRDGAPSAETDGRYYCYAGPGDAMGGLTFSDVPASAPILHFGGPWKLWLQDKYAIAKGRDVEGYVCVGAQGVGPGSFVSVGVEDGAPEKALPVVKFLPSGPTVRIRHRC
jgi:hypothetical protein